MFKETDRTALLWGTIIGVGFAAATFVQVFYFPNLRLPFTFTDTQAESSIVTAFLLTFLIASYRKLWSRFGFWVLMFLFFSTHIAIYYFGAAKLLDETRGAQKIAVFVPISVIEFAGFGLIVARFTAADRGRPTGCGCHVNKRGGNYRESHSFCIHRFAFGGSTDLRCTDSAGGIGQEASSALRSRLPD